MIIYKFCENIVSSHQKLSWDQFRFNLKSSCGLINVGLETTHVTRTWFLRALIVNKSKTTRRMENCKNTLDNLINYILRQ